MATNVRNPSLRGLSYRHRGGSTPLLGHTVDDHFRAIVAAHPDREAVISLPQNRRLTYRELDLEVEGVARALMGLGMSRGDRVGIWSTDNVEWVLLQLATARVGAILVNINPAYRSRELLHALRTAGIQVAITIPAFRSSRYVEMLDEVREEAFDLQHVVVFDPEKPECPGWREFLEHGERVEREAVRQRSAELDFDDPINIQFTSGTTGSPKPVMLTHHNILNNGYFIGEVMDFTPDDRLCVPVPFYHCFGMVVSNLACLSHGAAIVIPAAHFEAGATLEAIAREKCTAVHGVPTMFNAELHEQSENPRDLSSLRTGIMAGAPCPEELVRRVQEELHCPEILIGYGQTEASPVTHSTRLGDSLERRFTTVGTNLPHQECKVIDPETGVLLPLGEAGEVCFRGYHVMHGYYQQEESTREAIDESGWLHSGDLGVMDEDGYLSITGRLKEMIIRGGENIYPAEIEAFYFEHPKVAEVAVFGYPDPELGEEVGAWIALEEGETADPEELREYARGKIAHFKIPRRIWIVKEFPLTVTGKIQKFRIRELVMEDLTGLRSP